MSANLDAPEFILQRQKFYTSEVVDNFLKKHGVPKTRIALGNLAAVAEGKADSQASGEVVEILGHVYFQVHAQQLNIRDKANGKLIVSIRR
jgi:hypothetical protein